MNELSTEQLAVVTSDAKHILVASGPGSGKSSVLIARINHLISKGVSPSSICAISFTNTAANVMRERLGEVKLGWCGTLHSLMFSLIREQHPSASVMDEETTSQLIESISYQLKYNGTKTALLATIAKGIPTDPGRSVGQLVAQEFYQSQLRNQAFSFDSILAFGYSIISNTIWKTFSHVLVDEVNDASEIDFKIYESMIVDSLFYVGDFDQQIFGFRGACDGFAQRCIYALRYYGQHAEERNHLDWELHTLSTNYRSTVSICDAANSLIGHNTNRLEKRSIPFTTERGLVTVTAHATADDELLSIAQKVRDLQEAGEKLSEMAILVRTNHLVDHFTNGLKAFSIAVCERSEARLPEDWRKTMLLLAVIASPNNDFLMKRYLPLIATEDAVCDILRKASSQFTSINRSSLKWPENPLARLSTTTLETHVVGNDSINLVREAISALPPDATTSDLLMELHSNPPMATAGSVDGVYVGTVHSAKGREWDNVFLPAFEDEIIPGHKVDQIEDERRIAYVALTRARHFIGISWSELRYMPWRPVIQFHHASRFIAECGIATS